MLKNTVSDSTAIRGQWVMDDVYVVDGDAHRPDFPMLPDVVAILLVQNLEVLQPAENAFHSPAVAEDVFVELLGFPYFVQQLLLAESFDFRLGIRPRNLFVFTPEAPVSQQLLARWQQLKKATLTRVGPKPVLAGPARPGTARVFIKAP